MSSSALKETIDRMVEDAIRRILPNVMNEVLVRTLAGAGVVTEDRPRRKPMKRKPVREARQQKSPPPKKAAPPQKRRGPAKLREMLDGLRDETAGADFFHDPRAERERFEPEPQDDDFEIEAEEPQTRRQIDSRISSLPPELQGLAEGMSLDDDDGEMWGDDESDSAPVSAADPRPIGDVQRAAKAVGVDFSRMKGVIAATTPQKVDRREAAEDARNRAQFEASRIARLRESLGGVKPVG